MLSVINYVQHSCTKHFGIRHRIIWELVESNVLILEYIETQKSIADFFFFSLKLLIRFVLISFENL